MRASSIHDHWIKAIKSHDSEVVARLDSALINDNLLSLSHLIVNAKSPLLELNVCLFHVGWNLWLEERNLSVNS